MMNRFIQLSQIAAVISLLVIAARVEGHGTPILVNADTSLIASGGVSDSAGFAPMLFFESSEVGDPFGTLTLPSVGPVVIWQLPGLQITGLSETSSLSIEVVSRPVNNVLPVQQRSLWYWNPTTSLVSATTSPLYLLGTGQRFSTIDPAIAVPPPPFLLADPIGGTQAQGGQQGFHNHGLVSYALDNSPVAAAGAYGFFARLTSDEYGASEPFLVVFNRGVDYERMAEAAAAINAAAFLPGDYNHDDRVDAADYIVWRNALNSTTQLAADGSGNGIVDTDDYGVWRGNFGLSFSGASGGLGGGQVVPEPHGVPLLVAALCICNLTFGRSGRANWLQTHLNSKRLHAGSAQRALLCQLTRL